MTTDLDLAALETLYREWSGSPQPTSPADVVRIGGMLDAFPALIAAARERDELRADLAHRDRLLADVDHAVESGMERLIAERDTLRADLALARARLAAERGAGAPEPWSWDSAYECWRTNYGRSDGDSVCKEHFDPAGWEAVVEWRPVPGEDAVFLGPETFPFALDAMRWCDEQRASLAAEAARKGEG